MRQVLSSLLVASLVLAFFVPVTAAEMVNGTEQSEVQIATVDLLTIIPLGPEEVIVVFKAMDDDRNALIVLYRWQGGREVVVVPW